MSPRRLQRTPASSRQVALGALVALERGSAKRLGPAMQRLGFEDLHPRDRGLALELAQGTERSHLFLDHVLGHFVDRSLPNDPQLLSVLRLGAHQLLHLWRIPIHAAVFETVGLLSQKRGFANAVLRNLARHIRERPADPEQPRRELPLPSGEKPRCLVLETDLWPEPGSSQHLAVTTGLPEFLVQRWVRAHGHGVAAKVCQAVSRPPAVVLRLRRTLPVGLDPVAALGEEGILVRPLDDPRLLHWVDGPSPFSSKLFLAGLFVAQDPTAYQTTQAVDARPGERILDLCAAPGTKAVDLAEAVGPAGKLLAYDADSHRRGRIAENAKRMGLASQLEILDDSGLSDLEAEAKLDRVLVDAPCSNTGVLSRRVELRRRISEEAILELAARQRQLLVKGLGFCRPGGRLIYSTCSIEVEENQAVVDSLLESRAAVVELQEDSLTLPGEGAEGCPVGGGYCAVLLVKAAKMSG